MRYLVNSLLVLCIVSLFSCNLNAQDLDDLLSDLQSEVATSQDVIATFKATRVINGHSVEMLAKGDLEFRIAHRFGRLNTGAVDLWGLDLADNRIGLDYGITNWLMTGIGRSSFNNVVDYFLKARITRQQTQPQNLLQHFSINWYSNVMLDGRPNPLGSWTEDIDQRFSYAHQLIIAKKINDRFSLQITPTAIYESYVPTAEDQNLRFALGTAGRVKLTNRVAITAEHFLRIPFNGSDISPDFQQNNNSFSVGFDIETGGHVFQLHFTNSRSMVERGFIQQTNGTWANNDIHFGFNITRNFTL
jgi:hypothetical protein